jgi:hypothetical protein
VTQDFLSVAKRASIPGCELRGSPSQPPRAWGAAILPFVRSPISSPIKLNQCQEYMEHKCSHLESPSIYSVRLLKPSLTLIAEHLSLLPC